MLTFIIIFFLVQISFSKQIFNSDFVKDKGLLLYIEPNDIIEIRVRHLYGIFFSSWEKFDNLIMEVYFEVPNNKSTPLQKFDSSNGLIGIAFPFNDFVLHIRNEGKDKYKLYVMISKFIPCDRSEYYYLPKGISLPIEKYAIDANLPTREFRKLNSPYIINYDSENSKTLAVNVSLMVLIPIVFFIYLFTTHQT